MKEKNHFWTKIVKFKRGPKNGHFPKGLVLGFCPKIEISLMAFFLQKLWPKKSFFDILEKKDHF